MLIIQVIRESIFIILAKANIQYLLKVERDRYNVYVYGVSMLMVFFKLVDIYYLKTLFSNYIDE